VTSSQDTIANSARLRANLRLCTGPLETVFERLWAREDLAVVFPSFLVLLHQIMRASVPLMECALRRCEELQEDDPLARALRPYYRRHIEEERDHDLWTLEDLAASGFDSDTVLSQVPSPHVAALSGAQYYWVQHHHPAMLMGHIAVLESYPPGQARVDKIREATGLPDAAFRTLRMHGEFDLVHRSEIDDVFDALPLKRPHFGMIGLSMFHAATSIAASVETLGPIARTDGGSPDRAGL